MHKSLNAVLKFDEDTEGRNAADNPLERLTDELRHILDLLHIRRLALCLDGDALTRGGVFRRVRQHRAQPLPLLRVNMPRRKGLAQESVHKEIGIAADGRSKMRVVACGEPEMSEALRRIARLLHGAQRNRADDALLGRALHTVEDSLNVARAHLSILIDVQPQSKCGEKTLKALDLLGVRRLVHAVDKRLLLQLHVARNRLIRDEHTLLDDGLTDRTRALHERDGMPLRVELHLDLGQLKVNGAAAVPLRTQSFAQTAQRPKHRADVLVIRNKRLLPRKDFIHQCIGQPTCDVNHTRHNLVAFYLAVRADLHLTRHREAINALVQAADPVREFLRQHGYDAVNEIDTRAAPRRLHIQRLAHADVVTHIGDVDAEEESAVLLICVNAVVDVLRILAVDRDNGEIAAVTPPCILLGQRVLGAARGCLCHGGRECFVKVIGAHHSEHIHTGIPRLTQHLDHTSLGAAPLLGPLRDLYDHLAARLCAAEVLFQNEDIAPDLRAVGRDEAKCLAALERADNMRIRTFKDADDLALACTSRHLGRGHTRHDAIAVHGGRKCRAGHKYIRLILRCAHVRDDKTKSLGRHGEPPHDEVHAARQSVKSAAVPNDCPLRLERHECRRKKRLLLSGESESRENLRRRQRAIGVLPHKGVNSLFQRIQLFLFHMSLFFPFLFRFIQQE